MTATQPSAPRAAEADLTVVGRAIADRSRAQMLSALLTGTAWTVGELASYAGVARNTASDHVRQLAAAGLVTVLRQGRHTYVALAGPEIAAALEAVSLIAPPMRPVASLRGQRDARELTAGRTCYHHLAGVLGVALADRLRECGLVGADHDVTPVGRHWFTERGVDLDVRTGRVLLRPCLDWTERRPHLAGVLADRLADRALAEEWVRRGTHPRAVHLTPLGERRLFGD
ncbi:ArsR/SmtB family transcription factor [Calidifontibacter terrae]